MSLLFVYALTLFNGVAVFAAQMVLSLYALKQGAGPFSVGVLASTFSIFPMLLAVTAGKLVDRYGARWPMFAGSLCGALGLLLPYQVPGMPSLYVAGMLAGVAVLFINLTAQNIVGQWSTVQNRARNFSNHTLTIAASSFLGPLVGGFSIDNLGHTRTCLALGLLAFVPVVMLLVRGGRLPGGTRRAAVAGGGGSIRQMLADPQVRHTLATGMLVNAGLNLYQVYMPVYAHSIGLAASTIGIVIAMNSTAAIASRFALPGLIRKFGEQRLLAYAFFVGAAALAAIPLLHAAVLLGMVSFAFGLGMGCGQPIITILMYSSSKDGRSGEALGLKVTTNQFTKLASPIVFGLIASGAGLLPMFWVNAVLMAAGGWYTRAAGAAVRHR